MRYSLRENLSGTSGTVSNLHGFLHVFNDHGFRNKWTGYWSPPYKFLDYFSFRINGLWLSGDTLEATDYSDEFVFHHSTGSMEIDEKVEAPDSLPGIRITLQARNRADEPKAARVTFETGVDIRHMSQDIGPGSYELDEGNGRLTVSSENGKLMLSSDQDFEREGEDYVKEHHPGERQRCFVPGQLVFSEEVAPNSEMEIEIEITTSGGSFDSLESIDQELVHEDLGRCFNCSLDSVENLTYDRNGKGIIAGHPWFQTYWARDSFWTLLGMIDAGYFELAEEVLENFVDHHLSGRIFLDSDDDDFPRADTYPLFVMACDKLERHHGLTEKLEGAVEDAMDHLEHENGVVAHEPEATWMDTLERSPAVDIQSLWLEAAEIQGESSRERLRKGLKRFKTGDYMKDFLGEDAPRTINPAVPLMLGQLDEEEAENLLERINAEFSSRYGARTRSMVDPGYSSSGYHTGSSWGLTTMWAAAANLRYGNETQGLNLLEKMPQFLDRNQLGALPEAVDSESGELLGAPEQAWSAGLFIHVIDTYLLGIKVREDHVEIDPADISCERRGKKIRGETLDLEIENGEARVLNDPDLDILL
ncbi:MAG: amylo-alpha-1,6-glucosidase [Candidatus Nanohaloarchaea archaeon]